MRAEEGEWLRAKIIELLEDPDEPNEIILLGDLNEAPPDGAPHAQLQEGGYLYLLPKENGDDTHVRGYRLDHFYVTETARDKVPKKSSFVVRPEHYGETPVEFKETYSDHYPISMEFVCVGTAASHPTPADRASGVSTDAVLAWLGGRRAGSHDVYLGTNWDDVNDANTSSSEYKGNQAFDADSYAASGLELETTYYWRIDEVNETDANGLWKGRIWSFTTSKTVYVPSEYPTIQAAIDSAWDGVTIIADQRTHHESINFKGKSLMVRSMNPDDPAVVAKTIINGSNQGPVVTFANGENRSCLLTGFTITNGNSGIYCSDVAPTITNCAIVGNAGAGVESWGTLGRSSPTIVNCTIAGNKGHGIYARGSKTPTVRNCIVVGNKGVGIDADERPAITNCTVVGNELSGISAYRATVTNSIIWGNWPEQIVDDYNNCSVIYSDVQGGWPGDGNIDAEPYFADADGPDNIIGTKDDNLRLTPGSPCIDIGNNDVDTDPWLPGIQPLPETDFDGRPRIMDGDCNDTDVVDMGAYEFDYAYIGDFDYQCDVDFEDFAILGLAWLTEPGDDSWDPHCDISVPADSRIDWRDLRILTDNWLAGL